MRPLLSMMVLAALVTGAPKSAVAIRRSDGPEFLEEGSVDALKQLHVHLWQGMDDRTSKDLTEDALRQHHEAHRGTSALLEEPQQQQYMMFGHFDSGTNLFEKMVGLNFPDLVLRQRVWKHSLSGAEAINAYLKAEEERGDEQPHSEMVAVVLTRSPMSVMASWKKAPYELNECFDERLGEDMLKPCVGFLNCLGGRVCDQHAAGTEMALDSPMDAYNRYMRQYVELRSSGGFKKVLYLTYENLVRDPAHVMTQFGETLGLAPPKKMQLVEAPAKNHGEASGHTKALQRLEARSWRKEMPYPLRRLLCKGFDMEVLTGFHEDTEQGMIAYTTDCQSVSTKLPKIES